MNLQIGQDYSAFQDRENSPWFRQGLWINFNLSELALLRLEHLQLGTELCSMALVGSWKCIYHSEYILMIKVFLRIHLQLALRLQAVQLLQALDPIMVKTY